MRKFILLAVVVVLLGAGCSANVPAKQNVDTQTAENKNVPSVSVTVGDVVTVTSDSATSNKITDQASYSMSDVQSANNATKCWTVINGNVYDLTKFVDQHKAGPKSILSLCGVDGTSSFTAKHGGQAKMEAVLAGLLIGILR